MTREDAARIQSHADRTGGDKDFASRAQSAADRRTPAPSDPAPANKKPDRR